MDQVKPDCANPGGRTPAISDDAGTGCYSPAQSSFDEVMFSGQYWSATAVDDEKAYESLSISRTIHSV